MLVTRTGDTLSSMWFGGALLGTEEGGGGGGAGSYMQHWTTSVATIQVKMSLIGLGGALLGTKEDGGNGVVRRRAIGSCEVYATSGDIGRNCASSSRRNVVDRFGGRLAGH